MNEMIHVLSRTYLSRNTCELFIQGVVTSPKLAGNDPPAFWQGVQFLQIQRGGQSQADMLALFAASLEKLLASNRCRLDSLPLLSTSTTCCSAATEF